MTRERPLTPTERQLEMIRDAIRTDLHQGYTETPEWVDDTQPIIRELYYAEHDGRDDAFREIVEKLPEPETDSVRDYRALARAAEIVRERSEVDTDENISLAANTLHRLASSAYHVAADDVRSRLLTQRSRNVQPGMVHVEVRDPVTKENGGFVVSDTDSVERRIENKLEQYARGIVTCRDRLLPR